MEEKLYQIVNHILIKRKSSPLSSFEHNMSLRNDIGFDSLELAELTVRLENEFNIDIFTGEYKKTKLLFIYEGKETKIQEF